MPYRPRRSEGLHPEATHRIWEALRALGREVPEETEALWGFLGSVLGGVLSLGALWHCGKVKGLALPGLTSALAELGGFVGGGMPAGLAIVAAPLVVCGMAGHAAARRRNARYMASVAREAEETLAALQRDLAAAGPDVFCAERQTLDLLLAVVRQKHKPAGWRGFADHACPKKPEDDHRNPLLGRRTEGRRAALF